MKSLKLFLWLSLVTGVIYPIVITIIAQTTMPYLANGALLTKEDKVIGARLLGQKFTSEKYFWGRPSATNYGTLPSGGSQLSQTSAKLKKNVDERKVTLGATQKDAIIPTDLLFSSGSGLDPHISPEAAYFQLERVLKARGLSSNEDRMMVKKLIEAHTTTHFLTILAPDHVNVLSLNLALDEVTSNHD